MFAKNKPGASRSKHRAEGGSARDRRRQAAGPRLEGRRIPAVRGYGRGPTLAIQNAVHDLVEEFRSAWRSGGRLDPGPLGFPSSSSCLRSRRSGSRRSSVTNRASRSFPIDDVVWDYQPVLEDPPPGEEVEVGISPCAGRSSRSGLGSWPDSASVPRSSRGQIALYNYSITTGRWKGQSWWTWGRGLGSHRGGRGSVLGPQPDDGGAAVTRPAGPPAAFLKDAES